MLKCPCHRCEYRHIGCHSKCKRYSDYAKENTEVMKELKKAQEDIYYSKRYND